MQLHDCTVCGRIGVSSDHLDGCYPDSHYYPPPGTVESAERHLEMIHNITAESREECEKHARESIAKRNKKKGWLFVTGAAALVLMQELLCLLCPDAKHSIPMSAVAGSGFGIGFEEVFGPYGGAFYWRKERRRRDKVAAGMVREAEQELAEAKARAQSST